jgi:4'-phosphopantetheinyl transferase
METSWPEPTEEVALSSGDVHVWAVSLREPRMPWLALEAVLSPDEQQRAARFLRDEPRRTFVAGRAALRTILGRYLAIPSADVLIVTNPRGKPRLAAELSEPDLCFNVAHSGDLVLVAVARGCEVGVDVERLRPVEHWHEIAARYFHPQELAAMRAGDATQTPAAFLRCWTRKEAVLKAIGIGIGYPLDGFRAPLANEVSAWVDLPAQASVAATRCWLQHIDPCAGYVAAVATLEHTTPPQGLTFRW